MVSQMRSGTMRSVVGRVFLRKEIEEIKGAQRVRKENYLHDRDLLLKLNDTAVVFRNTQIHQ